MLDLQGLHVRAAFFNFIRSFFAEQDFLEVDTPIRQPVFIPEANIVPIEAEQQFLQSSPELCMKRLLAGGCQRIFQLCNCFRKGERGRLHLEEFRMLEWYRSGVDYHQLMSDCEELLRYLKLELSKFATGPVVEECFSGIDFSGTWQRLSVVEAFRQFAPMTVEDAIADNRFDEVLVEWVEPHLGEHKPVFLYDYPVALGSLAKTKDSDRRYAERFELYIKGVEIANGFSELTDEREQRKRFEAEIIAMKSDSNINVAMPERFLEDLKKLHSAAGIALGLDRLLMLAMNSTEINQVISFTPTDFE